MFTHRIHPKLLLPWLALGLGLLASVSTAWLVRQGIQRDAVSQFAFSADQITIKVRERLESFELILRGGAGLFESSQQVDRQEWHHFVEKVAADEIVPGAQGIGFSLLVKPEQLANHIASVRAEGFPDYNIRPAGPRDIYTSIVYLEPFKDANLLAFGYDMYAEPVRQAAMAHARDTGLATLSGKITLVQDTDANPKPGVLMYVPVYRAGLPAWNTEQRRAALLGWTYSPFRMQDMMHGILRGWESKEGRYVDLHIFDGSETTRDKQLYDSFVTEKPVPHTIFFQHREVYFYDHLWVLEFDRISSAPDIDYSYAWLTLAGGIAITLLLAGLLRSLNDTLVNASRIADNLTAEIQQREADLLEAQRIGKTGSWKLDLSTGKIIWSEAMESIFGKHADGPEVPLSEQQRFFTPDSWERMQAVLAQALEDNRPYEIEVEVINLSGEHLWMLIHGECIHNPGGDVVALQGSAADITTRKQNQLRIETLTRLYAALSACNLAVVQCQSQDELFSRICEVVVREGGMKMAWIGLVDPANDRIVPIKSAGEGLDYLDGIEVSVRADDAHGQGPTGTATRENHPVWLEDFGSSQMTALWRARGQHFGWAASAAIPISRSGKPVGALTFYSTVVGNFGEETRLLLEEMAATISFALDKLDAEAEAKASQAILVESEQRFRSVVEQSIAGAFIIQDGQLVYANPRIAEILGYPDAAELYGLNPLDIVAPKDRDYIGTLIRKALAGELDKAEALFSALRKNGTITEIGVNTVTATYKSRPAIIGLAQDISDRKVAEDQIRRYAKQLEHTFIQTVGLATTLSEMRDAYTAGHERRVAEIAMAIGREMGMDDNQLEGLRVGGYLHDVGKITVPSEILSKPGKLTSVEYALIKQHAQAGYDVLKEVDFPWPVALIALQHHERIDGSGYPQGLKGDEIIIEARITAVADVIESMASHRPYRAGLGIEAALAEIERGSGTAYDPQVVNICLRLFREKHYAIPSG